MGTNGGLRSKDLSGVLWDPRASWDPMFRWEPGVSWDLMVSGTNESLLTQGCLRTQGLKKGLLGSIGFLGLPGPNSFLVTIISLCLILSWETKMFRDKRVTWDARASSVQVPRLS